MVITLSIRLTKTRINKHGMNLGSRELPSICHITSVLCLSADSSWSVSRRLAPIGLFPGTFPLSAFSCPHETGEDRKTAGDSSPEERRQPHHHDIISGHQPGCHCHNIPMEPANNNRADSKSAAAELQRSIVSASLFILRGFLWPPLQPLPRVPSQSLPCSRGGGSRLCSSQPTITVPSIPRFWLTFYPSRRLGRYSAGLWAADFRHLPLPNPSRLPFPIPGFSIWPVHPQQPTEWPCTLPGHLQLWWLQLPRWALLFQLPVTNGQTNLQTRIRSSTAVLLKAPPLLAVLPFPPLSHPFVGLYLTSPSLSPHPNYLSFTCSTFLSQIQEVSCFTYLCCTISKYQPVDLASSCLSFSFPLSPYDPPYPPH